MFKPYGIIPPIITPFTEDGKFNEPVFRKMVNHLIEEGVHGVFPLGTTGEFYAFSEEEVRHILEVCKDEVAGRVPVYALSLIHISSSCRIIRQSCPKLSYT